VITRTQADRIATLACHAARAPLGMVGLVDGPDLRIIGGHGADWSAIGRVSVDSALTAAVLTAGAPSSSRMWATTHGYRPTR
jgi:hypothetical protein